MAISRRRFITAGAVFGSGIVLGGVWLAIPPRAQPLSLQTVLSQIANLTAQSRVVNSTWSISAVLQHCAQSIELAMSGYPEHQSDLFKASVGALAFAAFKNKGKMRHDLQQAIPGAPVLEPLDFELAKEQLLTALTQFIQYSGALAPHFAYGVLSKEDYLTAHLLHIDDHLSQVL